MAAEITLTANTNVLAAGYRQAMLAKRARTAMFFAVLLVGVLVASWIGEVKPLVFFANFGRLTAYLSNIVPKLSFATFGADMVEWYWGFDLWLLKLLDTLLMAYVGTGLGFLAGFCLCFAASANLVQSRWTVLAARRLLELFRTVPEIVYALIFVISFGLGPLPGVLAIAVHTTGALGKLFAEVNENIDLKPIEGVVASGGSWLHGIRFGVLPQVASNFASYTLLRFEINVRGAAVLGFVGAGGIGEDLLIAVRRFYYSDISAILLMIIATVVLIDLATEQIRNRFLNVERAR